MAGTSPTPHDGEATNKEKVRESCRVQRFLGFRNKSGSVGNIFYFSYYSPLSADVVLSLSSFAMILIILKSRLFYGNPDVETAAAGQLNHECRE